MSDDQIQPEQKEKKITFKDFKKEIGYPGLLQQPTTEQLQKFCKATRGNQEMDAEDVQMAYDAVHSTFKYAADDEQREIFCSVLNNLICKCDALTEEAPVPAAELYTALLIDHIDCAEMMKKPDPAKNELGCIANNIRRSFVQVELSDEQWSRIGQRIFDTLDPKKPHQPERADVLRAFRQNTEDDPNLSYDPYVLDLEMYGAKKRLFTVAKEYSAVKFDTVNESMSEEQLMKQAAHSQIVGDALRLTMQS